MSDPRPGLLARVLAPRPAPGGSPARRYGTCGVAAPRRASSGVAPQRGPGAAVARHRGPGSRLAAGAATGLAILVFTARPTPAPEASHEAPASVRAGYDRAAGELLCYCGCSRLTIKECTCGVAFELREQFESRLATGESADALIASYIAAHGEQSRNVPPKTGLNLLAWFGPGIAILIACAATILTLLVWVARGRKLSPLSEPEATSAEDAAALQRVERDLKELEL